ncbi:CBS domain-containing protein [Methanobacterium formicicum]|uniref:CBS domain-containing membrane protein n=1 Tax=Methanobacterium formicicum (strain DSM 3637 / PP1) TaxID=1204725 RepID=K2RE52_METFP|nr:CBS domain-containing protein [Methanobacterium formicicum]EKF86629.1 CBS domain-containing membrane protein [Methanobacterium formicicum DSM 3637]
MKIEDVMNEEVILAEENEQVSHARNLMIKYGYSRILVVDQEGKPVGILTEKDLTRKMRSNGPKWKRRTIDKISIRRVMTPNPLTINPFREVQEAVELMIKNDISSVPVVDGDEVVGIVTKSDLMNFYLQKYTGKWKVSDLMTSEVITVNENHSIGHVISVMEDDKIGKVIVMRDNEPVGIITSANISFANVEDPETGVSVEKIAFLRNIDGQEKRNVREVSMVTAGDIMTNHLIKIEQDEDAASAAAIMAKNEVSGMPVVDGNELVGIITKTDIIRGIQ